MTDKVWRLARIERLAVALAQSQDGDHRAQCAAEIKDEWAAIAAMEAKPERPEAVPTVRVKVAVAINERGEWRADGSSAETEPDWQWTEQALLENNTVLCRHIIEADVPLPAAPAVIKGEVTGR